MPRAHWMSAWLSLKLLPRTLYSRFIRSILFWHSALSVFFPKAPGMPPTSRALVLIFCRIWHCCTSAKAHTLLLAVFVNIGKNAKIASLIKDLETNQTRSEDYKQRNWISPVAGSQRQSLKDYAHELCFVKLRVCSFSQVDPPYSDQNCSFVTVP